MSTHETRNHCLICNASGLVGEPMVHQLWCTSTYRGSRIEGSGDFSIGSKVWPGISKLIEECGEVTQVAGKLMGCKGERVHWDGSDLKVRLEEELADLYAAIQFVTFYCRLDDAAIDRRAEQKLKTFAGWHRSNDPTPSEERSR